MDQAAPSTPPAPTAVTVVKKPDRVSPEDIDTMVGLIPRHAAQAILPTLSPEHTDEALDLIAEYCLNLGGKHRADVWIGLACLVMEHFPGTQMDATDMRRFCRRYVLPNIAVVRSHVARAIMERGLSLDTLASTLDLRQKMESDYDTARLSLGATMTEPSGKIVLTGTRPDELAALGRAALSANKQASDEMERFGFIPKSDKAPAVNVNLNNYSVGSGMSRLAGKPVGPIDAAFKAADAPIS